MINLETLTVTWEGRLAVVAMGRPAKLNAINPQMSRDFEVALAGLGEARALVITGDRRAFSAGADLNEAIGAIRDEASGAAGPGDFCDTLEDLPIPTIAAIEGYCLGGGLEIAMCCDLRVAGQTAQFGLPESLRGLIPGGAIERVTRLIGPARAKELMYLGDRIDATTAERWGLINRVVGAGEAYPVAMELGTRLANGAPLANAAIKALVATNLHAPSREATRREMEATYRIAESRDAAEGVAAFLERRPPRFHGQ